MCNAFRKKLPTNATTSQKDVKINKRNQWLIYGATGYTGRRTAERAVAIGAQPVLAARRGTYDRISLWSTFVSESLS